MVFPRMQRTNFPGYAALATLCLFAVALMRGRMRLGYVLLHLVVALGERWQEQRALARVGGVLTAMTSTVDEVDNPLQDRDVRADGPV